MIKKSVFAVLAGFVFLLMAAGVSGQSTDEFDHVVSNSEDWRDVYSIINYANLLGKGSDFLVSTRHGSLLMNNLNRNSDIRVISSESEGFVLNYDETLRNAGFEADEVVVENANLELIEEEELEEINSFIIVGNTYGYNAIAVASYAVITNSWVFFADRSNIVEIDSILSSRDIENVMLYGIVESEVLETLQKYDPEIINNGDRFLDNLEIFEKYNEIKPSKQIVLSNGEFIEKEIMSGIEPVLFTGKENVPEAIGDYIKKSDIEVGVLVGSDLVGAATNIRRSTGISVIVKFARGARAPTGAVAAVEGLDLFYLPVPVMELSLHSAKYNRAASQLEITYRSDSNLPIYFRGTITPIVDGETEERFGDASPVFIAPGDFKTATYSDLDFNGEELAIDLFTLFGESPESLERILELRNVDVELVNVIDECEVNVEEVKYSKPKESFIISIVNEAEVDCWVDIELSDVIIAGLAETLGSEGAVMIEAGKDGKAVIEQRMSEEDLEENSFVELRAYFGQREDGLVKVLEGRFPLEIEIISFATVSLMILGMIVLIAIFVILIVYWKRRNDDDW